MPNDAGTSTADDVAALAQRVEAIAAAAEAGLAHALSQVEDRLADMDRRVVALEARALPGAEIDRHVKWELGAAEAEAVAMAKRHCRGGIAIGIAGFLLTAAASYALPAAGINAAHAVTVGALAVCLWYAR